MSDKRRIAAVYDRMANGARYRPAAPSDGFGNINGPLDIDRERVRYASQWQAEEDSQTYYLGCPDYPDLPALVYIVEAARCLNGMQHETAARLLRWALTEIERQR